MIFPPGLPDGSLARAGVIKNFSAVSAPTVNDDRRHGYAEGSFWLDTANDRYYVCLDATPGAAVWREGGGLPDDGVTGAKLSPDAMFGASSKKLLNFVPYSSNYRVLETSLSSDTSFTAKINGTPSGTTVIYDTVTGNEDSIVPVSSSEIGKLVLRNTTRGTEALIQAVNTSTNTITVTNAADIVGWADNDDITCNSATCTDAGISYFFDLDLSGFLPVTAAAVVLAIAMWDTAANAYVMLHPYDAYAVGKTFVVQNVTASGWLRTLLAIISVTSQKICLYCNASGSATAKYYLSIVGWYEEAAT